MASVHRQIEDSVFVSGTDAERGVRQAHARLDEGFELLSALQQPPGGDIAEDQANRRHAVYLIRCVVADLACALGERLPEGYEDGRA